LPTALPFEDLSCKPIGDTLEYERGDGNAVKIPVITESLPVSLTLAGTIRLNQRITVNPDAGIDLAALPKAATAPLQDNYIPKQNVLDHPDVGGKVTICVLFYGDYYAMHKQCLNAILATVPEGRRDLRVASNAVCATTEAMLDAYVNAGVITKYYKHAENAYKYPVMREMFHDESCPITTKWVLWFDDDSICDVSPTWLATLGTSMATHHRANNVHMFGARYIWTANDRQRQILSSRPWFSGKPWRNAKGEPAADGKKIIFAVGGFWAITNDAIQKADIPDLGTGLTHTGGDWQIGEQLYQAGFELQSFNGKKQPVRTSSAPRRGAVMPTIDMVAR